ncbi:MAG: hypothetical protein DWQ01_04060 [Planctomycetota bacterium]|nr:MAG: hypothetical protein DWQ01_04060 [Planctomycetota bacterium]
MTPATIHPRLRAGLTGFHLLGALFPVIFLPAAFLTALGGGFQPNREAYGDPPNFNAETAYVAIQNFWLSLNRDPRQQTVLVLGLAESPGGEILATSNGSVLAKELAGIGVRVRVHDPQGSEKARSFLGDQVSYAEDLWQGARGVDAILVANKEKAYREMDLGKLASYMKRKAVFDCAGALDGGAVAAAGLNYLQQAVPAWPAWLDPELDQFAEEMENKLAKLPPEEHPILLIPHLPMNSLAGRSRWFLQLNYRMFPRRFYLPDAILASGTLVEFADWVEHWRENGPARGPILGPKKLQEAINRTGATWTLHYSPSTDFRVKDWRLIPAPKPTQPANEQQED